MIKPILTDEEWAAELDADQTPLATRAEWAASEIGGPDTVSPLKLFALANAAMPDDSPYKFTWADYDLWTGRNPEAQIVADKIRALLPPRA